METTRSYVLRCLPVRGAAGDLVAWRFSLQAAEEHAVRHGFNDLESVVSFLRSELCWPTTPIADGDSPGRSLPEAGDPGRARG
jgi:hypothetical protein